MAKQEEPDGFGVDQQTRLYWVDLCMAVQYATRSSGGLAAFMIARFRLPKIGDTNHPWSFRGWLLPAAMDLFKVTAPGKPKLAGEIDHPGRWGYWLHILETGAIPSGRPPQRHFHGLASGGATVPGQKNMQQCLDIIGRKMGFSSSIGRLLDWLAWALAVSKEPSDLDDETQEELYRAFCLDHWQRAPADYVGHAMVEAKGGAHDPTAFFPTPMNITELMTGLTLGEDHDDPTITINDPCIGSGRFLLSASNYSLRLSGQDINPTCVQATLINGAVYAPWLAFPFPKAFFDGHKQPEQKPPEPEKIAIPEPMVCNKRGQGVLF